MFVLLARDSFAPQLVDLWATQRENDNGASEKTAEARACAHAMRQWRMERDNL